MLKKIINDNYKIKTYRIELLDEHFGTKIYTVYSADKKYILKGIPSQAKNMENEGHITMFLLENGIKVAPLKKTVCGSYVVHIDGLDYHLQDYIQGDIIKINTAPDWYMEKSAQLLGRIQNTLSVYKKLKLSFGSDFFDTSSIESIIHHYHNKLENTEDSKLRGDCEERIRHLRKLTCLKVDTKNLTYTNSHGDFYFGQIIIKDRELTVIDWTSACCLPACMEVIMSYVYASPDCRNGCINISGLGKYLNYYLQYFILNKYDYRYMPYILYYYLCLCNYEPPYINIPDGYKEIFELSQKLMNWLHDNADDLSVQLGKLFDK